MGAWTFSLYNPPNSTDWFRLCPECPECPECPIGNWTWQHMVLSGKCPVLSGKCPVLSGMCPVMLSDHVRNECPECPGMSGNVR